MYIYIYVCVRGWVWVGVGCVVYTNVHHLLGWRVPSARCWCDARQTRVNPRVNLIHTCIYIYMCVCMCVCVCEWVCV